MVALSAMPLIALEAIVLDTETTGLDVKSAHLVEIGAVRLARGRIAEDVVFHARLDPGVPIPATATAVHGIDAAALVGAPRFAEIWPALDAFLDGRLIVGHSIGFDLAMLRREHVLAGRVWTPPRSLDTRLLTELVEPRLPDFSLETVASYFGVVVAGRHAALGDATTTAEVMMALVPRLAAIGIRTVAEAETACRRLPEALEAQVRAGWVEPVSAPSEREQTLARIDSYPYRHRVREVMSAPPILAASSITLAEAVAIMAERRVSSLYLTVGAPGEAAPAVADVAILTERDVLRAIAADGAAALGGPVSERMMAPVVAVAADAFLYRAIGRMNGRRIRHLAVTDADGRLVGALTARDLLRLRANEAAVMGDAIASADDVPALATAWKRLPALAASLVAEGVPVPLIAGVVSREIGALTARAGELALSRMQAAGEGGPPVPFALAVLGSGGRGESLLAADQDNALIFTHGDPDGPEDRWFARFGGHVADILDGAGLPYCKGGVMAKNPEWRGSVATWTARADGWISKSRPQDLLSVDIFFDMRSVLGDAALARDVLGAARATASAHPPFLKLLAEAGGGGAGSPLGLFGRLRTDGGRIDLKKFALMPVTAAARVLAVRNRLGERSTPERIAALRERAIGADADLARWADSHGLMLAFVLDQQLADVVAGRPLDTLVDPRRLSAERVAELKEGLSAVSHVDDTVRDLLFS
jgi:DNA polymerase-3 subunit epsilon/CBS domain-containing protein